MAGPVLCSCGEVLVEDLNERTVTPVGGEPIPFRRKTDYIICPQCLKTFTVGELLGEGTAGVPADTGEGERVFPAPGSNGSSVGG